MDLLQYKDVVIQVPETGQKSQPTDASGRFELPHLSFEPSALDAIYAGKVYSFQTNKTNKYPVIPRPRDPVPSPRSSINSSDWTEGDKCSKASANGYKVAKEFVLSKEIPSKSGYKKLRLQVAVQNRAEIVHAQNIEPESEGFEVQDDAGYANARQWEFSINGEISRIKVAVCLGSKEEQGLSRDYLKTSYWFY
jgi:hypothetical protein